MKKKIALVFGITGQDGSYLAELLLKKHYPENFIPIYRDGKEYTSFAPNVDEGLRLCDSMPGLQDEHLNSEGCKVIANSIVKKLKQYESTTD